MEGSVQLAHGNGGKESARLVRELVLKYFPSKILASLDDAAEVEVRGGKLAFTTDSYVIDPIFFPGGNIGDLAVCGTVNDLAMQGAEPKYLSAGLIIEEGLPFADLEKVLIAMRTRAEEAGVEIVTGDTKVVGRGAADKLYINTAGIGEIPDGRGLAMSRVSVGDAVVLNGALADHGAAIMLERKGINISAPVASDVMPLNAAVDALFAGGIDVKFMRDLTRGGLAAALNDVAARISQEIELQEEALPLRAPVKAVTEMLGLEPCHVANEGKFVLVCPAEQADAAVKILQAFAAMDDACVIGEVTERERGRVIIRSGFGSTRVLDDLTGEVLPRIC